MLDSCSGEGSLVPCLTLYHQIILNYMCLPKKGLRKVTRISDSDNEYNRETHIKD